MNNNTKIAGIAVLVILLAGLGWYALSSNNQKGVEVNNTDNTQNNDQDNGQIAEGDLGGTADPAKSDGKLPEQYRNKVAVVKTNLGEFTIEFFDNDAPLAVENFIRLSLSDKYNGSPFHRILKNTIIQGGDYTNGDGTGGASIWGKTFRDELNPETDAYQTGYDRGVVAMANAGPSTNGSQFFVNISNNSSIFAPNYTIFGKVIAGMDVVDKIGNVPTLERFNEESSLPTQKVVIEDVTIQDKE